MAVTNRYDTFKKYSKEQINSFRNSASRIASRINSDTPQIDIKIMGKRISKLNRIVNDWTKQSADYYKAFGSSMLEGSNVGVDSASVSVNEVPVDRTDPILDTASTPKRKKRGDGSASALGL